MIWHQIVSNYGNLNFKPNGRIEKISIRQNLSGEGIRVEFSNKYDHELMEIVSASISLSPDRKDAYPLTLNNQPSFEIPAEQSLWSDFLELTIPLKASLYLELEVRNRVNKLATSAHTFSDRVFKTNINDFDTNFVYGITSVAILTEKKGETIGFFGDSLTNQGYYFDGATNWFYDQIEGVTTFNEGISGNRLLLPGTSNSEWNDSFGSAAVDRFSHLITYQPDIAVILIGDNDLYQVGSENRNELPSFTKVISALTRIQNEAIVANIKPILVTLTPFMGAMSGERDAWSSEKEVIRQEVNQWIRQNERMIDLAQYVCDVSNHSKLAKEFDSGDHLHFSEVGGTRIGTFMAKEIVKLLNGR